jgi:pyruvate-ferredoxin/flavodoxin oxidoreductase
MDMDVPTVAKYAGAGLIAAFSLYELYQLTGKRAPEPSTAAEARGAAESSRADGTSGTAAAASAAASAVVVVGETIDGKTAASRVAYALSDVSFVYTSGSADDLGEAVLSWSRKCTRNAFGRAGVVKLMAARAGAASVVHGALQDPSVRVAVFASSQSVPLMIPNMYAIAAAGRPCVFHVAAQSVSADLTVESDLMGVVSARSTGFAFLAAYGGQECQDMALAAHVATQRARTPVLHFFDGARTSHELLQIKQVSAVNIADLLPAAATAGAAELKLSDEEIVAAFDETLAGLEPVFGRRYRVFEYSGAADAKHVVVLLGLGASASDEAVEAINNAAKGERVGVLKVRLYRPWSTRHFLAALPATVRSVSVLEVCDASVPLSAGPLLPDVAASFYSPLWTAARPHVQTARLSAGARGVCVADILAVFAQLRAGAAASPLFVVTPEERHAFAVLPPPAAGASPRKTATKAKKATSKEVVVWSAVQDGTEAMCQKLTTALHEVYGLHTQLYTAHDSFSGKGTAHSQLRVSLQHSHRHHEIVGADVVLVCDKAMLQTHASDILGNLHRRASGRQSTLVVPLPEDTAALEAALPAALRQFIAAEGVQVRAPLFFANSLERTHSQTH